MHWCQDETLAAMSTVPVVGYLFRKAHKWYHNKTHHKCHEEGCGSDHLNHVEELMPNPPGRHVLTMDAVDVCFGELATIFLMFDRKLLGTQDFPPAEQFVWFLSPEDVLSARLKNNFYEWNGKEWKLEEWCLPKPIPKSDVTSDNRIVCNVENVLELLHSIQRFSVEDGHLETWFDEDECPSTITEFIPDSFTRDLLELVSYHILGEHEQDTGNSNQGLGQEQEANSGPTQSNQEASQETAKAGEALRDEN